MRKLLRGVLIFVAGGCVGVMATLGVQWYGDFVGERIKRQVVASVRRQVVADIASATAALKAPVLTNSQAPADEGTRPPTFFTNAPPRSYTDKSFIEELGRRLTPEERALVVNPLAGTPQMGLWARELTAGATNDLQKAKALYLGLLGRASAQPVRWNHERTAQEAFSARDTPGAWLSCGEAAYLYVALARAVGLKAYCVSVEESCDGRQDFHGCAALFFGGESLLVDPAQQCFGVRHKRFVVLDDLQAAAVHLCAMANLKPCQVSCKLAPDLIYVRGGVFNGLVVEGRWEEAREEAATITRLEPEGLVTLYARALIAWHDGKLDQSIELLHRAVLRAPGTAPLHVALGHVYADQGKLREARAAYEDALRYPMDEERTEMTKQALARIKDQMEPAGAGAQQASPGKPSDDK